MNPKHDIDPYLIGRMERKGECIAIWSGFLGDKLTLGYCWAEGDPVLTEKTQLWEALFMFPESQ